MRETTGPILDRSFPDETLLNPMSRWADREPDRTMASVRDGDHYVDISAAELWTRTQRLAKGLIASGVEAGDRVGLMAATSLEWLLMDHAIVAAGGITVPIYETSSAQQLSWILHDSGAVLLVTDTAELGVSMAPVAADTACREVLAIGDGALDDLVERGEGEGDERLDERITGLSSTSVATIIYTSGTTGRPKGCVLTHGNLRANVAQVSDALGGEVTAADCALLFLPLAHILSKMTALYCLEKGTRVAFGTSLAALPEELAMVGPTVITAVPRIFEKVYSKAQHAAEADGKGRIFDRSADTAIRWSRQGQAGKVKVAVELEHRLFERLVYAKIGKAFGGNLRLAFSGGGPLGERLTSFFDGIGVRIYEGYGLTETSPILTISRADAWRPGAVGKAVAGTTIAVHDDGELLAKGPQVFQGYWRNQKATDAVFDSHGWFHTGDVGHVDDDDFVFITGRIKDLIVTSAGKNVAPAPLEDLIRANSLVSQAMVIGDRRPFIAALVTIDEEAFEEWASDHGHAGASIVDMATDDALRSVIQKAIDEANSSVSRAESIRAFAILPHDLDADSEEITPTLKVRRMKVLEHYAQQIEALYQS